MFWEHNLKNFFGYLQPDYEHMDDQRFRQQQMERGKQSKKGKVEHFLLSLEQTQR